MDSVIKIIGTLTAIIIIASAVFFIATLGTAPTASSSGPVGAIYFFYSDECSHCHDVMPFIINMSRKYPEANITMLEVWHNETNQEVVASVHKRLNTNFKGVPEVVIGDIVLVGTHDIQDKMEQQIRYRLGIPSQDEIVPDQDFL